MKHSEGGHSGATAAVQWERTKTHTYGLNTHMHLPQQFLGRVPVCYMLSRRDHKCVLEASTYDNMVCTIQ